MVKRISLIRMVGWCLIGACPAVCQSKHPAAASGLPDAPSAMVTQTQRWQRIGDEAQLTAGPSVAMTTKMPMETMSADAGAITEIPPVAPGLLPRQPALYQPVPDQKGSESAPLFFKHLTPALLHPNTRYMASDRDTVV